MPTLTTQELLDKRMTAVKDMRGILDVAEKEGRDLTPQEESAYNGYKDEITKWNNELAVSKKKDERQSFLKEQEEMADKLVTPRRTQPNQPSDSTTNAEPKVVSWNPMREAEGSRYTRYNERQFALNPQGRGSSEYQQGFSSYLRSGTTRGFEALGLDPSVYSAAPYQPEMNTIPEPGGIRTDDDKLGGYLVPSEQFMGGLLKNVDDITQIYKLASVMILRQSQALGIRCMTQKMSSWDWGAELSDALLNLDESLRFGKRSLTPHYCTGSARISRDLIRSSVMDVEQIVYSEFARDLGYLLENAFVSGDGVQKPLGVLTASNDGIPTSRDFSTGTTTSAFTFETLIGAKYDLKQQYRNRGRWMFNRARISDLAQIRTDSGAGAGTGGFIWQPTVTLGTPDMLLGLPVDENEFFPSATGASKYFGMLACWEYYQVAVGLDMEIQRLIETRASKNQNEYICRAKIDAQPILSEAFVRLQYAAS